MVKSQNGFAVPPLALHGWQIPRVNETLTLANNDAGFALAVHVLWFNDKIEPVQTKPFDDWAFDPDPKRTNIVGGNTLSNHDSGTAIDINAVQHPFKVATTKTFSSAQIALIRKRLYHLSRWAGLYTAKDMPAGWDSNAHPSIIRWGGDYRITQDAMHWEANIGPSGNAQWAELTKRLSAGPRGKAIIAANKGAFING